MSHIHFVGGEKGGVGKSVFSRLLSQYFLDRSITYSALDADQSHASLTRHYEDYTQPLNLDEFESIDQVVEIALEDNHQVLIDLPAQSQRFLDRWMDESDVLEVCEEAGIGMTFWYLVDDGRDSVQLLSNFLTNYGDQLDCVIVKNKGRGDDFTAVESLAISTGNAGNKLLQIEFPALHPATMRKIDKLNFSFWAASNIKEGEDHLSLMQRQRTKVWMKKAYAAFDEILIGSVPNL